MIDVVKIRSRSLKLLKKNRIPLHPHLPLLDNDIYFKVRQGADVAAKIISCNCLSEIPFGANPTKIIAWLNSENGLDIIEPKDLEMIEAISSGYQLDQEELNALSWLRESLVALCFAGKLLKTIPFPYRPLDIQLVEAKIPPEVPIKTFQQSFCLRPKEKIIQELDFYYCLHASIKHPELWIDKLPEDVIQFGIVIARRRALEWACDKSLNWADVSLDT